MKMKIALLTAVMAVAVVGSSFAADWNFGVTPESTWSSYINVFTLGGGYEFGFSEGTPSTASANWAAGPAQPLTMSPNTRLYDENSADAFWVNQTTFEGNHLIEFSYYQEVSATIGDTVQFDFESIANNLPAGWEARGFVKVLDGFASWATTQYEWVTLGASGSSTLSAVVADAGGGTEVLQAGFSVYGPMTYGGSPESLTGVQIIPEPATIGLVGIAGLGMFVARRRFTI